MDFKIVGQITSKEEADVIQQVAKFHLTGQRAKDLGFKAFTDELLKED